VVDMALVKPCSSVRSLQQLVSQFSGVVSTVQQTARGHCPVTGAATAPGCASALLIPHRSASTLLAPDQAYINGQWTSAASGKSFEVLNPANGQVLCSVPDMGHEETESAIQAAHSTLEEWKNYTAKERGNIMRRWFNLVIENQEGLAKLITAEGGKPLQDARYEVLYGASFLEWFSEEAKRAYGETIPSPHSTKRILTIKQPIGVAGLITPWNFPHAMIARKAAAAIAAGCTVVLKPAEDTPLSALAMCQLAEEAGVPGGVLNVVTASRENTPEIGRIICQHPLVAAISFTGSTFVGKLLMEQSASTVKKTSMELGGNAPFIVFNNADVEAAVAAAIVCKFRSAGQTCSCANRFLVQEDVHDRFVSMFVKAIQELKVGNGMCKGVTQGPLINHKAAKKMEDMVKNATKAGARVETGGKRHSLGGCFFKPTLLTGVKTSMMCAQEEIFGPIAPVIKFKTEEEAIHIANDTQFGLASYIFSKDIRQIWRVAEKLEYGMVGLNEGLIPGAEVPMGGVKQSGLGREGSKYGMEEFMEVKYLCFGGIK